jgi:hypothetical protein
MQYARAAPVVHMLWMARQKLRGCAPTVVEIAARQAELIAQLSVTDGVG